MNLKDYLYLSGNKLTGKYSILIGCRTHNVITVTTISFDRWNSEISQLSESGTTLVAGEWAYRYVEISEKIPWRNPGYNIFFYVGEIPKALGNLVNLQELHLNNNQLTGM